MSSSSEEPCGASARPRPSGARRAGWKRSHTAPLTTWTHLSPVKRVKADESGAEGAPCQLCHAYASTFDPLLQCDDLRAHHFCLLFSSGLGQRGSEDEGLRGFLPVDVRRELRRGSRLKCVYCKQKGATVGCARSTCKKSYHLPCGMRNKSVQQYFDQFKSFCSAHRPVQKVAPTAVRPAQVARPECGLCARALDKLRPTFYVLRAPCCGGWLHRDCLQSAILAEAGTQCPLCFDNTVFAREIRIYGLYFPVEGLKPRPTWPTGAPPPPIKVCGAKFCICPRGRQLGEGPPDHDWYLTRCAACQSRGIHAACGGLTAYQDPLWLCYACRMVVRETPENRGLRFKWGTARQMRHGHEFRTAQELKADLKRTIYRLSQTLESPDNEVSTHGPSCPPPVHRSQPPPVPPPGPSTASAAPLPPPTTPTAPTYRIDPKEHYNLTLEDLIVRGLNREYNPTFKKPPSISSGPQSPTKESSPGDSDYESSQESHSSGGQANPRPQGLSSQSPSVPGSASNLDAKIHAKIKDYFKKDHDHA
ncbi:hypothetical protein TCAL_09739 [Tigriopus californicus]|uniref:PHD-type domain-containing protein n=1 Tax=Tigriopus californicus TaxID=6832 RepID=A0A553PD79_TIGCA|nr:uncharacterized protein LOC131892733 [Tigriopus californicus]TRY75628.1 hypothetical protein TCAL_09739 [Tigriopus californicus]|eukprot:TCALIF_09739-PA protein Name:"Similar to G2e3 G2/M phase-specific E3 ubiquitin-protein ligase (Mus musculus)" AED:0.23 eAED:0.25 QI:0/-1/0/1/-1/1/1/0/532